MVITGLITFGTNVLASFTYLKWYLSDLKKKVESNTAKMATKEQLENVKTELSEGKKALQDHINAGASNHLKYATKDDVQSTLKMMGQNTEAALVSLQEKLIASGESGKADYQVCMNLIHEMIAANRDQTKQMSDLAVQVARLEGAHNANQRAVE